MNPVSELPIVYACSGCSSAAQMANHLAVRMDRRGDAEMSCIAGVGGDVPSLVRVAKSGRPIVALDGCALHCTLQILKRHDVTPAAHYMLRRYGVKKLLHVDFSRVEADTVLTAILEDSAFPHPAHTLTADAEINSTEPVPS